MQKDKKSVDRERHDADGNRKRGEFTPRSAFLGSRLHMDVGLDGGLDLGLGRLAYGLRNRRPVSRGRAPPLLLGNPRLRALLGRRQT